MSSSYGENIRITIFGQSHSEAVGVTVEGIPAGIEIDTGKLNGFLSRRAPGRNDYSTERREEDRPEFIAGLFNGKTCGTPLTAIIRNNDTRSSDYSGLKDVPRPGHADYTAEVKYKGAQDYTGGGHFSGRLTAPLCIAGGICLQILEKLGIKIFAHILSVGDITDEGRISPQAVLNDFPVIDSSSGEKMKKYISLSKENGDSVGGIVECAVYGVPAGLGDPIFGGMENRISSVVFGIPAVKGIEFGRGFESARMTGSENNDAFTLENGTVRTETNNSGGILGGITNGMPIVFRAAFKPTPSIAKTQKSVNLKKMSEEELTVAGRHDPCIVPRAVPCIEAACAIAVYDAFLARKKETD